MMVKVVRHLPKSEADVLMCLQPFTEKHLFTSISFTKVAGPLPKKTFFAKHVCNLGQKVGDKFTKLSKTDFSIECFTADFLQFFTKKSQNLAFGWTTGNWPSNPSISGISLKVPNFLIFPKS